MRARFIAPLLRPVRFGEARLPPPPLFVCAGAIHRASAGAGAGRAGRRRAGRRRAGRRRARKKRGHPFGCPLKGGDDLLSRFRSTIGAEGLNFSVRNGKRWIPLALVAYVSFSCAHPPMRRCAWEKPCGRHCTKPTRSEHWESLPGKGFGLLVPLGCHRRRCCTCGLSTSSSSTALGGDLILGRASRLDAFSAYPGRTRLPCGAPGGTAGTPAVRPTRSSRTSVGAPQISNARNR